MLKQLMMYGAVGLLSNLAGYLVYLLVTWLGLPPKIAMTSLYGMGALVGFFGNSRLTFAHGGRGLGTGIRYLIAHATGYLINLAMLWVGVDHLGYPHQLVQAAAVFVVATFLFVIFKVFVFRAQPPSTGELK